MMGTPAYMAPEQVKGGEIDARADLYAMGVVFYRLTTAALPFKGDTPFAMAQSQVSDPPTPVSVRARGSAGLGRRDRHARAGEGAGSAVPVRGRIPRSVRALPRRPDAVVDVHVGVRRSDDDAVARDAVGRVPVPSDDADADRRSIPFPPSTDVVSADHGRGSEDGGDFRAERSDGGWAVRVRRRFRQGTTGSTGATGSSGSKAACPRSRRRCCGLASPALPFLRLPSAAFMFRGGSAARAGAVT